MAETAETEAVVVTEVKVVMVETEHLLPVVKATMTEGAVAMPDAVATAAMVVNLVSVEKHIPD